MPDSPSVRVLGGVVLLFLGLATAAGAAEELAPGGTFFDDDGNTHEGAIEAIAAASITRGCGVADLYCPSDPVSRVQMAAFVSAGVR